MGISWQSEPNTIGSVLSINNVRIRLTQERWLHITNYHKELIDFQLEILLTISNPDNVYSSPEGTPSNFAAVKAFNRLTDYGLSTNLIVHYKEVDGSTGFILTAFVMSDKRLNKRFSSWHKLR